MTRGWGRVANCAWTIGGWSVRALTINPDLIIIGSDPVMSAAAAIPWKFLRKETRMVHWCFDLYPEAAVSDGMLKPGFALSALKSIMRAAYRRIDLLADIGDCMRERLSVYESPAKTMTLVPWALSEPAAPLAVDPLERKALFGSAKLGLMYSGNFGRAHTFTEVLRIARLLRTADVHFTFSVRGNRTAELREAVKEEDRNISFVPFASQDRLEARLGAADIQVVSLRSEWTGTAVPSKFFGALAAGRPVLFVGSEESYIARTIRKHGLGWVCSAGHEDEVSTQLRGLAAQPSAMSELREQCHRIYQTHFAREMTLEKFDRELRHLSDRKSLRKNTTHGLSEHATNKKCREGTSKTAF
jgi:colanic acid biosynthesis glycosyl transferase WcaI